MRIPLKIIPQEITNTYDLNALVDDQWWIYMRIEKGMYDLKQAGIIEYKELVKHMAPFGYHPVKHTPGLWVHNSRKTLFSMVVDDFCVQYFSTEDADHFLSALRAKYLITVDMDTALYIGIKLTWDYVHKTVTLYMPSYVQKALHRFQHILREGKEYSPHTCSPIQYVHKIQYTDLLETSEYLSDKETNLVKQVCGTFLYYAITIDNTILPALSDVSSEQSKATENTAKQVS